MSSALAPTTAALQVAEVARPTARPGEPNPRSEDAFAARLARARNDAPVPAERGVRASAQTDGDTDASTDPAAAREATDGTPPASAEWVAGLPGTPAPTAAAATPISIPVSIEALEAAALAAAAAKGKAGGRLPTDETAQRSGLQASDTNAPFGATSAPPGAGVTPEPVQQAATKALDAAQADAALRDALQTAPSARPASAEPALAVLAAAPPGTSSVATAPASLPAAAAHATAPGLHIAAAVDTPAFAPALAQQVSWMVREGLGVASLQLNPPELGPVSVQIVVDGRQARVDFGAEMALTRNAIEDSLPRLASALQEAGLTLSGGGVFDGPPPRDAPEPARERSAAAEEGARPTPAASASPGPRPGTRGLVDLVA